MRRYRMRFAGLAIALCALFCLRGHTEESDNCGLTRYDCAVYYVEHQKFDLAVQLLDQELQHSPQNLKALNLMGIALTGAGHLESANEKFREALKIDPRFYPARKNLAVNEFNAGLQDEAEMQFNRVLQDSPADAIAHIYLGEINFGKKQYKAALEHYDKGGDKTNQNPVWLLHSAECMLQTKDRERAKRTLEEIPADDADDRFQAGLMFGNNGAFADAADFFGSIRKIYKDPYIAGYNQVLMLNRADKAQDALKTANALFEDGFKRAELYNLISESFLKLGRLQDAYDALRTATRLEPENEDNYADLAALCLDYEDYVLGLDILDVGLHYIPNSYRLHIQKGVMLVMRGLMKDAESEFNAASALAPDKPLPYVAIGEVWMQADQAQKAADMLREKVKLNKSDFLLPYIFAIALIRSGAELGTSAGMEAVTSLETSIRRNPNFSHSRAELGKLLLKEGRTARAIEELEAATRLDPGDSGPAYQLAQAYRKEGRKQDADAMLARVAKLHSEQHEEDLKKELKHLVRLDTASTSEREAKP